MLFPLKEPSIKFKILLQTPKDKIIYLSPYIELQTWRVQLKAAPVASSAPRWTLPSWAGGFWVFVFILKVFFLYSWETQRERQRHRQRERQAPCREPDAGLDPGTPGSRPVPKADAQQLSHPGILKIIFETIFPLLQFHLPALLGGRNVKGSWNALSCSPNPSKLQDRCHHK